MKSGRDFLILTNNPLVEDCLGQLYEIQYERISSREILVRVRDLVYLGHTLYTHPLSGSVKPNETPYKSVVVSKTPCGFSPEQSEIISDAIAVFAKFLPKERDFGEKLLEDFQLIDYTLLAGALDVDAEAGLSKRKLACPSSKKRPGETAAFQSPDEI